MWGPTPGAAPERSRCIRGVELRAAAPLAVSCGRVAERELFGDGAFCHRSASFACRARSGALEERGGMGPSPLHGICSPSRWDARMLTPKENIGGTLLTRRWCLERSHCS